MKNIIYIVLLSGLASCSKAPLSEPAEPVKMFTATIDVKPTAQTVSYDLYVSNDPTNLNDSFMIWAGRFTREQMKSFPFSFGFDFTGYVCMEFKVTPGKKLYGATRETSYGNIQHPLNYNSVTIK